jgi:hypothetical protein
MLRRALIPVLLVIVGVGLFVGGVGLWAQNTLYDSDAFAGRVTSILKSGDVRREISERLTEQLVRSGNQQAISFRPAFETGIDSALNTDTFRSIFRGAIKTAHADVLKGGSGGAGINLSESVSIIASTLQLSGSDPARDIDQNSFAASFADITKRLGDSGVWDLEESMSSIAVIALVVAVGAAAGAIALSGNRRRTIWWLGWTIAAVGVFTIALLWAGGWYAERQIADGGLAGAVRGAIGDMTVDLRTMALWTIAYGVIVAGAAATAERRYRFGDVVTRGRAWLDRRRQTTRGTVLVAVGAVFVGFLVLYNPLRSAEVLAVAIGMGLTYVGTVEIIGMVRRVTAERASTSWWRPALLIASVMVLLVGATAAVVISTSRSARRAAAEEATGCNGAEALCDLRLDEAVFPSTHNSMSSALYPGWLFGEQIGTINDQLNAGIRGFLIDTHYGVPSSARMPGSRTNVVITDRAAELASPDFEQADPAVVERANALAERVPKSADATRDIYLCHNYCELGAVSFSTVLAGIKAFIDAHPGEVIILDIQDATTPADTAQAFIDAGIEPYIATLDKDEELPTLGELVDAGTNLIVFAERGGTGAPPWYQSAYNGWIQETKYNFPSSAAFDCLPHRGGTTGKLFLVNHWVTTAGPSPSTAHTANGPEVLLPRLDQCVKQRGLVPNMVAVDYAQGSPVVELLGGASGDLRDLADGEEPEDTTAPTTTVGATPSGPITTLTGGDPDLVCAQIPDVLTVVEAYAEAVLSQPAEATAETDLVYSPSLVDALDSYVAVAPNELADRARPLLTRAKTALALLGLDDASAQDVVRAGRAATEAEQLDGATLELRLQATMLQHVTQENLDKAAQTLGPATGDLFALTDLGYVSPEVGRASGFECTAEGTNAASGTTEGG